MFCYNITFNIEIEIFETFKIWLFEKNVLQWVNNEWFNEAKFLKVNLSDLDTCCYCLQLETSEKEKIRNFQEQIEGAFRHKMYLNFGEKVLSFATELQLVEVFKQK